jgi:hypothetical protein
LNLESNLFFNYNISAKKIELFIISLFGGILVSYLIFKDYNSIGYIPKSLILSQATQDNTDVGKRVNLYFQLLFFTLAISSIFYLLLYNFGKKLNIGRNSFQISLVLSSLGLLLLFSNLIGLESQHTILFISILFCISLVFVLIGKTFARLKYLHNTIFFSTISLCSFLIAIGIHFLTNSHLYFSSKFHHVFFTTFLFLIALVGFINANFKISFRTIFSQALAIAAIPVLLFFVIEFQFFFFLKFNHFIRYKILFVLLLFGVLLTNYFIQKRKLKLLPSITILNQYLSPLALFGFLILTVYKPFIEFSPDVFELANPANAALRTFSFNDIPLIDFMSSHMLSEQLFSWIYFTLFGYNGTLEFTSYFFLADVLFFFLAYWFLKSTFKSGLFSLLFLLFFPLVGMLFSDSIFIAIIGFASLYYLKTNQSSLSYFVAFLSILMLIVWRLDTGIAALFSSVIFLPVLFYCFHVKVNLKAFFTGLLSLSILILLFFVTTIFLRDLDTIKNNFLSAWHYIGQNQAHGYSKIANELNTSFYFFHFFIPLICLCCIAISIMFLRLNYSFLSNERKFILASSIFLFLICLSNFQRGLVRHSFFEGSEHFLVSTFFIALGLFILSFIKSENPRAKFILLLHTSFFLLLSLKYFGIERGKTQIESFLTSSSIKNIDYNFNENIFKGRIKSEGNSFANFGNFFNSNFGTNQSFLDFSNTPMMYFFTQRKVPSYFCQPLQNSIDDYLQMQLLKKMNTQNTPVVVYSNAPKSWFDETDGIPNSLRQYLLAEHVYKNYKPFSIIDNKCIWIDKNLNLNVTNFVEDTISTKIQIHEYKKAAKIINNYFKNEKVKELTFVGNSGIKYNKEINFSYVYIPRKLDYSKGVFAKIFVSCVNEPKKIKLISKKDYSFVSEITFEADNTSKSYMVRLSNHYLWHTIKPDHIVVDCENGANIEKVEFYYDNRF